MNFPPRGDRFIEAKQNQSRNYFSISAGLLVWKLTNYPSIFFKAWQSGIMASSGTFVAFVVVSSVILFMVTLYVIGSIRLRFSKRLPQKYKLGRGRHAGICCTGCGGLRSRYKSTNPYRNSHKRYWRTMASKTTYFVSQNV